MARIALLELPNAVMMRTLVFGELTLSFESASMPSSSGIRTSMITRSGLLSFTFSTTSVPVVASTTAYPSSDSSCFRSERIEESSSATKIVLCATFVRFLPVFGEARASMAHRDTERYRAGDRDQQTGVEDVSEQPADEDQWQPAQVGERDPRTEDSRARRRLGPLLEDRHSWNVKHDVCGPKQNENENG